MPAAIIYTSSQACAPVLDLTLPLAVNGYELRSLVYFPKPQPVRQASLRLEMAALLQIERTIAWVLGQYAEHRRLPDAAHERDLQDDLAVTRWQISQVTAKLQALGEGTAV